MKVVIDSHIPFIADAIRSEWPCIDIFPLESEQINAEAVRNADILVVRTRTQVNEALLSGSSVRLVCTATIGFDHIDTAYCEAHGIRWTACPGCNAQAVCNYVEEALDEWTNNQLPMPKAPTIGVVGVGHVGSLVAKMAARRGLKVLLNDPPKNIGVSLDASEGIEPFSGGEIADCDIITFHVPLDESTHYLCSESFLSRCKPNALIINAARGGVVDEQALLRSGHPYILDTWENEPHVNTEVLQHAYRASMHIAGYSVEGKRNASQTCLDIIAQSFCLPPVTLPQMDSHGDNASGWLERITRQLKANPEAFESIRKNYPLR
ncbi:MAG: 4-phosphoerythronate dehydrogenase [Paludibacteraceae bacterium]|nr:4-phosphoerythronate dehydrogenase [Paludibacteraceae bacterium]